MIKQVIIAFLVMASLQVVAQKKPNVVVFFVDDLGWADVGYQNPEFNTPNIDQFKKEGVNFDRAYVATPTCSPSRASLLTGKEPIRLQMPRHITQPDKKTGRNTKKYNLWPTDPVQMPSINWLPLDEITYAERLKEFGYYNMFIGKWHLGHEPYHPIHQGFDEQYGTSNFGHPTSYYQPFFKFMNPLKDISDDKYLTDVLTDKAVDFIENYDKNQPFSLTVWHYGVHGPQVGRKDLIAQYKAKGWEDRYAEYGAMVSAVDESLGRIRKELEEKGIADNTIILFTSDQGGYFTNFPLRGGKVGGNTLGEGGARVPFVLYYPGVTKANTTCDVPIQTLDVYPTLVEIASGKKCIEKQIQGKSLMPLLKGEKFADRDLHFFRSYEDQYCSMISGDWKYIKYHKGKPQLYNIKNDIGEVRNLIYMKTAIANKMAKRLSDWEQEAVPSKESYNCK
ncbi:sulfatase [Ancylomarina sp. 16SWW S1-10-2]|uniref:sulfatase n=1 Tax=Ancylomarina sp. 16SWW S1-10-2 TaxID=2499681 RepID=UPI0012AD65F9|nr:sulfatase [Ancylomarina sp. 16SWW S1-10-2]MRT91983.1 sulfatase [Ancylomarina sp. 16SWW S1-10-2]